MPAAGRGAARMLEAWACSSWRGAEGARAWRAALADAMLPSVSPLLSPLATCPHAFGGCCCSGAAGPAAPRSVGSKLARGAACRVSSPIDQALRSRSRRCTCPTPRAPAPATSASAARLPPAAAHGRACCCWRASGAWRRRRRCRCRRRPGGPQRCSARPGDGSWPGAWRRWQSVAERLAVARETLCWTLTTSPLVRGACVKGRQWRRGQGLAPGQACKTCVTCAGHARLRAPSAGAAIRSLRALCSLFALQHIRGARVGGTPAGGFQPRATSARRDRCAGLGAPCGSRRHACVPIPSAAAAEAAAALLAPPPPVSAHRHPPPPPACHRLCSASKSAP